MCNKVEQRRTQPPPCGTPPIVAQPPPVASPPIIAAPPPDSYGDSDAPAPLPPTVNNFYFSIINNFNNYVNSFNNYNDSFNNYSNSL